MPEIEQLKESICEIGRRMYQRQFCAANEGNISCRGEGDTVLCTPTLQCKGYLQPCDICTVGMDGEQIAGERKRTSEILLHLEIYNHRPEIQAVVHCHPPHATAFAIARIPIPMGVLPEPEVFLGEIPIAPYKLPGTKAFAETIHPFVRNTNLILLANHGTVSYGQSIEQAYWFTEILDGYCRTLLNAFQLGPIQTFTPKENRELLELRQKWGFRDPRSDANVSDANLASHPTFRRFWPNAGVQPRS